ncbi:hypothetical protein AB0L65_21075 [Nonomuraea sp. NPDC052116]|uniref:hypothetical protein n=1 Tax=Nonomuraea sp. NPDC052116 TaxID=3155665 RepID=UPI00341993E5
MTLPSGQAPWRRTKVFWSAFASAFDMSGARAFDTRFTPSPRRHTETSVAEGMAYARDDTTSITVQLSAEQAEQVIGSIPAFAPLDRQRAAAMAAVRVFGRNASLSQVELDALIEMAALGGKVERRTRNAPVRHQRLARWRDADWSLLAALMLLSLLMGIVGGSVGIFVSSIVETPAKVVVGVVAGLGAGLVAGLAGIAAATLLIKGIKIHIGLSESRRMSDSHPSMQRPGFRRRQRSSQSERSS